MSERREPSKEQEFLRLLRESALTEYPNPERYGCPDSEFLYRLATDRTSISLEDPRLDHVAHCSPCFRELSSFQQQAVDRRRRRVVAPVGAAVAVVLLVVAATWLVHRGMIRSPSSASEVAAQLDFRDRGVTRGADDPQREFETPNIPRGHLSLIVLLPLFSEDGEYDVEIVRATDRPLASARGGATIQQGVTTLRCRLDASKIAPGDYLLGIRRADGQWVFYPVRLT